MFDKLKEKISQFTNKIHFNIKDNNKDIENINISDQKNNNILNRVKDLIFKQEIHIRTKDIESPLEELKIELLESEITYDVCEFIISKLKRDLIGTNKKINIKIEDIIKKSMISSIEEILNNNYFDFDDFISKNKDKFIHILFVGINGSGKTTSLAKVAFYLKEKYNIPIAIAAGDTYRTGAIEQLEVHANNLKLNLIMDKSRKDPTSVIYDAIKYCNKKNINILLSDTSGRMHNNKNLMSQLDKIYRLTKPNIIFYVEDSTSGHDTIERLQEFSKVIPITGTILTKLDTDTKGGGAISISYVSKKPIIFVGIGQNYEDFKKFNSKWFINELFQKRN